LVEVIKGLGGTALSRKEVDELGEVNQVELVHGYRFFVYDDSYSIIDSIEEFDGTGLKYLCLHEEGSVVKVREDSLLVDKGGGKVHRVSWSILQDIVVKLIC
jgi:hypothetical protein